MPLKTITFPGQGSQKITMGKSLAEQSVVAKNTFAEIDDALGEKLSQLMFEGDSDVLNLSKNTQPALMAHSLALVRVLEQEFGTKIESIADALVGHSLGEYSALIAAGVFSLADGARLLRLRGQAMQQAVPKNIGAMAAILGLEFEQITEIAKQATQSDNDFCTLANDNCSGQLVISGHKSAVERAMDLAKAQGAKRALLLPVSVPSHCALMRPAADKMQEALEGVLIQTPKIPVFANISTEVANNIDTIKQDLIAQLCGRVRFRETITKLANLGHESFTEIGTGKVLTGLVKRIAPEANLFNIENIADIESFLKAQDSN